MKEVQNLILMYLDDETESSYENLISFFTKRKLTDDRNKLYELLKLLSIIIDYHHRNPEFSSKIKKIILSFEASIRLHFTDKELFNIFKESLLILPFLFEQKLIDFNEDVFIYFYKEKHSKIQYFTPEIRNIFIKALILKEENVESKQYYEEFIQRLIDETSNENHEKFLEKREKGENDSYICELIRDDSVQEFIGYINRFNIPLSSTIKSSIYETNKLFDTDENLSLIDYAAFHGSIQIFRYLRMNNVQIGINI